MKYGERLVMVALLAAAVALALIVLDSGGRGALAAEGVIYVDADATGLNNGRSWATAYTTLQPALEAAVDGDEIWVAAGTYTPSHEFIPGDPRSASFQMVNGVAIYGGFEPGEGVTRFEDRDWVAHETVLSGDVGIAGSYLDDSYHVFYHPAGTDLDGSAILDGVSITRGYANGDGAPLNLGGGMYNHESFPTLANCRFYDNRAYGGGGGGMYNSYSSPVLTNVTFEDNGGSGMYNYYSAPVLTGCTFADNRSVSGAGMSNWASSPVLTDCTFTRNTCGYNGGGMLNDKASSPTLTNCVFTDNWIFDALHGQGSGMANLDGSSPVLTGCTFANNLAVSGGGMYNHGGSSPALIDCAFEGNKAYGWGGGMFNHDYSSPSLTNCTFSGNVASAGGGGGIYNRNASSPMLANCTFSGNSTTGDGGGMCNANASPTLTNCTFTGNSATRGGGLYNTGASPTLTNCILWGDTSPELVDSYGEPVVTFSDVEGGYPGVGNIDVDPLFVDAAGGDLHLGTGSPCVDAGDNGAQNLPPYDFEGDGRILDGDDDGTAVVDMGADEFVNRGPVLTEVEIDIKPKTESNTIKLGTGAKVPVAILTTAEFDAADVNPATVLFAGAGAISRNTIMEDVDDDGDLDMVLYFKTKDLDLVPEDKEATLTGRTYGGDLIEGTDEVKVR